MYNFNCDICSHRCDGISKGIYDFKNDVEYSEFFEKKIIQEIKDMDLNEFIEKLKKESKERMNDSIFTTK